MDRAGCPASEPLPASDRHGSRRPCLLRDWPAPRPLLFPDSPMHGPPDPNPAPTPPMETTTLALHPSSIVLTRREPHPPDPIFSSLCSSAARKCVVRSCVSVKCGGAGTPPPLPCPPPTSPEALPQSSDNSFLSSQVAGPPPKGGRAMPPDGVQSPGISKWFNCPSVTVRFLVRGMQLPVPSHPDAHGLAVEHLMFCDAWT
ncbi:hypothetical protein ACQJBY_064599 [Aegilops geniculata]